MKHKAGTVRLAGAAFALSVPAFTCHSHAMFDHEKLLTVTGTVIPARAGK